MRQEVRVNLGNVEILPSPTPPLWGTTRHFTANRVRGRSEGSCITV